MNHHIQILNGIYLLVVNNDCGNIYIFKNDENV